MTSPASSWTGSGQDGDLRVRGSHQRFRFLGVSRAPRSGNGVDLQVALLLLFALSHLVLLLLLLLFLCFFLGNCFWIVLGFAYARKKKKKKKTVKLL